jgi:hypothetical protein
MLLAYLEEKYICIWCEKGELLLVSTFSTNLWGKWCKDIELVKYKEKLAMTCIDRESDSWKYGLWRVTMEDNGTKDIQ